MRINELLTDVPVETKTVGECKQASNNQLNISHIRMMVSRLLTFLLCPTMVSRFRCVISSFFAFIPSPYAFFSMEIPLLIIKPKI